MPATAYTTRYTLFKYSAEQVQFLQSFQGKNLSSTEIAGQFNRQFGTGLNTEKIRGKLKRLGVIFKPQRKQKTSGFMGEHYSKTGAPHPRHKPIGSIRQGRDGMEIKISDTKGAGRKNWQPLAVYAYEQAHNVKLQKLQVVFHIDGNNQNNAPENLILVHRRDLGHLNAALKHIPPEQTELRKSIILMTRITQLRQAKTGEETASMRYNRMKKAKQQQQQEQEAKP